jgi:betaine-aldehyde dehydrogenase
MRMQRWLKQTYSQQHFKRRRGFSSIPSVVTSSIDNELVAVRIAPDGKDSSDSYVNRSPATGLSLCQVQLPTQSEINAAMASSKKAFPQWSTLSSADRGHVMTEMASLLWKHEKDLVHLETVDSGIPISQIRVNHIPYAIQTLEYYASLAITGGLSGRTFETPTSFSFTRREPLGVCAAIGPWNYPLVSMMWKLAPALACGNALIYKPSECTPLTAWYAAKLWQDVLPCGILQVLTGDADTARQLVRHGDIAKVSLTGSVATGVSVAQESAATLKRTTLELGGKSPLLVFSDAVLDSAVRVAVEGNFVNNGQVCSNCTRVYVQQDIVDEFLSRVVSRLNKTVVIGDNTSEATNMGPLMTPPRHPSQHYDKVVGYIERAKIDSQVDLICGGKGYKKAGGHYVEPTVFLSKADDSEIAREETFGPIMTVLSFETEEEAIARANQSPFGLAAGVMTRDVTRAHRVSRQLQAGNVWVNNWNMCPVEMPFPTSKQSGYGNELGIEALQSYSQTKHVYMEMEDIDDDSNFF